MPTMQRLWTFRFALAWALPLAVAMAAGVSFEAAAGVTLGWQVLLALLERVQALAHSPPPTAPRTSPSRTSWATPAPEPTALWPGC